MTRVGSGPPLLCLPGGPFLPPAYLGTLGGLDSERTLVLLDPPRLRADLVADELEGTRAELGLETVDLLGHSAGAAVALYYAARHPQRLHRLALITPSTRAVDIAPDEARWESRLRRRQDEPWFAEAWDAIHAWDAGDDSPANRRAAMPFSYGRWDAAARQHAQIYLDAAGPAAMGAYYGDGRPDPAEVRAGLRQVTAPVLDVIGGLDPVPDEVMAAQTAALFADATVRVQPGAGHYPWLDDAAAFRATLGEFLAD